MKKRGSLGLVCLLLGIGIGGGCSSGDSGGSGGGNNNGGTAGTSAAGSGAGSSAGTGIDNPDDMLGTSGTGALDGDAAVGDGSIGPDDMNCGSSSIDTEVVETVVPGNVIVVFDKSGSMVMNTWPQNTAGAPTRLLASGAALLDAIRPIADLVNVGTIFFPSNSSCGVDTLGTAPQISMAPGPAFITAWDAYWMGGGSAGGMTPLLEGLTAADATISGPTFATDFKGTTIVLVITDGEPNCTWNPTTANGLAAKWLTAGVKTYVVGIPGSSGTVLNDLAAAGGTTAYIEVTDSTTLQTKVKEIATATSTMALDSCKITLNPKPVHPELVQMVATENGMKASVPRVINADAGWSLSADGTVATLEGLLCRDAKAGRFTKITFEYGCVDLPPIPPPEPE